MGNEPSADVTDLREQEIEDIKRKIEIAYTHPREVHVVPGTNAAAEFLLTDLDVAKLLNQATEEGVIKSAPFVESPSVVYTGDSHLYKVLLEMAFEKLAQNYDFKGDLPENYRASSEEVLAYLNAMLHEELGPQLRQEARQLARDKLIHEWQHAAPALGYPSAKFLYAVEFTLTAETHQRGLRPMLILQGELPVSVYREVLQAPERKSPHDIVQNAKNVHEPEKS